jgi:hypothetical protein
MVDNGGAGPKLRKDGKEKLTGKVGKRKLTLKVEGTKKPRTRNGRVHQLKAEELAAKIITEWAMGTSMVDTSKKLDVPESMVARVRGNCPEELQFYIEGGKTDKITELVEKGLEENLLAMNRIVEVTKDEVWLAAQRATELATFFGVISDKTVRVLAAIERANERRLLLERSRELAESEQVQQTNSVVRVGAN